MCCRQFCDKTNPELPFYYWTPNERFSEGQTDFNTASGKPSRLHQLHANRRDNGTVFAAGRAMLPARNSATIRQSIYRFDVGLPPVPEHLLHSTTV